MIKREFYELILDVEDINDEDIYFLSFFLNVLHEFEPEWCCCFLELDFPIFLEKNYCKNNSSL